MHAEGTRPSRDPDGTRPSTPIPPNVLTTPVPPNARTTYARHTGRVPRGPGAEAEATNRGVAGALLRGFERCASLAARRRAAVQGVVVGWRAWTGSRARGHCGGAFAGGRGSVGRPPVRFATAMACARAVVAGWRVDERHVRDVLAPPRRNAARPARGAGRRPRAGRRDVPARTRPCSVCATFSETLRT